MNENAKIIGFYKNHMLIERDYSYYVVNRQNRKVIFKGCEEEATKLFVMLAANFINEDFLKEVES